ncbi:MAG TPA: addiction module protein [Beutenbergiaceae bacterium]|nr:addiction module protein [Beutenbergiaceae bacterium]
MPTSAFDADERLEAARQLLLSVDQDADAEQSDIDSAWDEIIDRRVEEIVSGRANLVNGREAHARVRAEVAARQVNFACREHAEALDEYRAAAKWYESNRPGWGDVFMDAADAAIESILDPSISLGLLPEPAPHTTRLRT